MEIVEISRATCERPVAIDACLEQAAQRLGLSAVPEARRPNSSRNPLSPPSISSRARALAAMPPALPRIASARRLLASASAATACSTRVWLEARSWAIAPCRARPRWRRARPARRHRRRQSLYPRPRRAPRPPPRSAASASDRSAGWLPSCSSPCTAFSNVRPWSTDEPHLGGQVFQRG